MLRRQGFTYSQILSSVPVAKSTLSLWFHDVGLAEHQKQRITQKRIEGQMKGAKARRIQRIRAQEMIWSASEKEIGKLSDRELWLIGVALYWAEGSKEKEWNPGGGMKFSNSDSRMVRVFLTWAEKFSGISKDLVRFEIYIHESKRDTISEIIQFWSRETRLPISRFHKIYFKKNKIDTKGKNVGLLYNGQLRVSIPRSTILMRRIEGWVRGIDNNCRIV